MNVNRLELTDLEAGARARRIYEFDSDFCVSYVNYTQANEQVESQLLLTLEKSDERRTFAFFDPEFEETNKNLASAKGLFISSISNSDMSLSRIEIGDCDGNIFFNAKRCKNITPTA